MFLKIECTGNLDKLSNTYGEQVISIYLAFFEKCLHFEPCIKSGSSKNQGGYEKVELRRISSTPHLTVVIWKYD